MNTNQNADIQQAAQMLSNAIMLLLASRDVRGVGEQAEQAPKRDIKSEAKEIENKKEDADTVTVRHHMRRSLAGTKAEMKPCPVTGIPNTHRRFSYLMPEVRTAANLRKYKGWSRRLPKSAHNRQTDEK